MFPSAPSGPRKVDSAGSWKKELTVLQVFQSEVELLVHSGFIYVPLLFDPDIAGEVQDLFHPRGPRDESAPDGCGIVVEFDGKHFVRSLSIDSILRNYASIDKGHYDHLRRVCLPESLSLLDLPSITPSGRLRTIVLKIMPYFIRKGRGLKRRQLSDEDLLELIHSKLDIPQSFMEKVDLILNPKPLQQRLNDLDKLKLTVEPLPDGPSTGKAFSRWLNKALVFQIIADERESLEGELRERGRMGESKRRHVATLLYMEEEGSFELDGFGFRRIGTGDDYLIYKRTGEYILKDYYARSYRFPDCRVAVSTTRALKPFVVESYKHPFLMGHAPGQEICISGHEQPQEFNAENIIRLLEEGISALIYGYDPRRRNGYHSLDPTLYYVKTIEFVEYRI
jgi:hypothetical protein